MSTDLSELLEESRRKRWSHWMRYAASFMGTWADAEDAVQEALRSVLQASPDLGSEMSVHRYVLVSIRTCSFKLLKKRSKLIPVEDMEATVQDTSDEVLKHLVRHEDEQAETELTMRATREVGNLPPEQRQAVELLILREPPLKLREVAELQGVVVSTVHKRLRTALQMLAEILEDKAHGFVRS